MKLSKTVAIAVLSAMLMAPAGAAAQYGSAPGANTAGEPSAATPGVLARVGIDQKLNQQIPLDLVFTDETGREVKLGEFFGKRPVILALVYYECPMLCTQVLNGIATALSVLDFNVGREFDVVAVSINPREGPGLASQKKAAYVERYKRPGTEGGWHFLTGRQESITQLAQAVGFRYEYDDTTKQFAHGAGIEVLTPQGVISKYFYGIEFSSRDLKFGLMEASNERIGTVIDQALLLCYHYDPATGQYGTIAITLVRVGGIATIVAFLSFLFVSLRRERAAQREAAVTAHRT